MLILTRKQGEIIILETKEGLVRVKVSDIRGDRIRIGVDAPTEIAIHREEVYAEIAKEREAKRTL